MILTVYVILHNVSKTHTHMDKISQLPHWLDFYFYPNNTRYWQENVKQSNPASEGENQVLTFRNNAVLSAYYMTMKFYFHILSLIQ